MGQPVQLWLTNSRGQRIGQQAIDEAATIERRTLRLGELPGVYFLQVSTPTDKQTVKIVRH
ncbi:T9SS type A sorting domain-containing protein [Spirosoma sp. KNUC1025]|uniref:T9SS type A sorting domain-containing protein n=1 Tax=Spirosoma sp. KNUC1025 TaxID=2894082 RepID=UPI0038660978